MHIGIAGPLGTPDIEHLLDGDTQHLPREMKGGSLLVTLIEAYLQMGHQVSAFTTDPALLPRRDSRVIAHGPGLTVHYVPRRRHGLRSDRGARGRMLDLFALERQTLADAMREAGPEIIHAHWSYEFAAAALDTGLPCLVTCHDSPWAILKVYRDLYRLGRLLMARSVFRRMQHATVVSPYLVKEIGHMTPATLHVVANPLPESILEIGRSRPPARPPFQAPRIAMLLNGWSTRKNAKPAMQAMPAILKNHPQASMHLYGPGYGQGEPAQQWARANGLEAGLVFHGWTPYAQTMQALAESDLLLHPALEESFGMTIAEAMALGVPVVAGEHSGAVPWVLGGPEGGGLLTDVRSANSIAEAVLTLLSNPDRYERCALSGRERAHAQFTTAAVANAYMQHYTRILGENPSALIAAGTQQGSVQ